MVAIGVDIYTESVGGGDFNEDKYWTFTNEKKYFSTKICPGFIITVDR